MKKRVLIPAYDSRKLLELVTKLREKHAADGDASPLIVLNWSEANALIDGALETEEAAIRLKREKLNAYQQRRLKRHELANFARRTRDILTGVYPEEMKVLGLWGFDVLDNRETPRSQKEEGPPGDGLS